MTLRRKTDRSDRSTVSGLFGIAARWTTAAGAVAFVVAAVILLPWLLLAIPATVVGLCAVAARRAS